MKMTLAQARLAAAISRSGMTDTALAAVLGVNQSTVSRLRHGKIGKVFKHQEKLDQHFGIVPDDRNDDLAELIAMARSSPALREVLVVLHRFMRENA